MNHSSPTKIHHFWRSLAFIQLIINKILERLNLLFLSNLLSISVYNMKCITSFGLNITSVGLHVLELWLCCGIPSRKCVPSRASSINDGLCHHGHKYGCREFSIHLENHEISFVKWSHNCWLMKGNSLHNAGMLIRFKSFLGTAWTSSSCAVGTRRRRDQPLRRHRLQSIGYS